MTPPEKKMPPPRKALLLHGPNLNMVGKREPALYGKTTYEDMNRVIKERAVGLNIDLAIFQSNHEGAIIDAIQSAYGQCHAIIINPGGYTHTSVAIRDALLAVGLPVVEVHMSNVYKREEFRYKSYISDIAVGAITGFGIFSYLLALDVVANLEV